MHRLLAHREIGGRPSQVHAAAYALRVRSLDLSSHIELSPVHSGAVTSLSLDAAESRYLLSASADGGMAIYDVEDRVLEPGSAPSIEPCATVNRQNNPQAHRLSVSTVQWFPHDSGIFVSGGFDQQVKLWDTNVLAVACDFALPGRVHCIAMSPVATSHNLIASCGEGSSSVTLCDPATGSTAHELSGHRAPVWAVCWNPANEHELVSGGSDRSVRIWDIRRAASCLRALDSNDTVDERRRLAPSDPKRAARTSGSSQATTMAGASRELAMPLAHTGAVTSVLYVANGLMILSAGRDHRMRLWHAGTGANMLVHYADTFNTARGMKQIGASTVGGGTESVRAYFPSTEGLAVYDLLLGKKVAEHKAHIGEVTCCVASQADARVFSGGADHVVHAWTPPPCGLSQPAPAESPGACAHQRGAGAATSEGQQAVDDGDNWSDSDDGDNADMPAANGVTMMTTTSRTTGTMRARKRARI